MRLHSTHIGGQLNLNGSEITNKTGIALTADNLHTDSNLRLRNAVMRGTGEHGTVRLLGAHIGGQAHMTGTQLTNASGPLLLLSEAHMEAVLFLPASVVCPTAGTETTQRECADRKRQLMVSGLVFPSLGEVSWRQWLHLLSTTPPTTRRSPTSNSPQSNGPPATTTTPATSSSPNKKTYAAAPPKPSAAESDKRGIDYGAG